MDDRREKTLDLLAEIGDVARPDLVEGMDLVADVGLDSAKAMRLLVELEEVLSIEISDEDAAELSTVGDVLAYVAALG